MTRCPTCGSLKTDQANNRNEFTCGDCDSTFNPVMEKIYTEGSYHKLCGNVANLIAENMLDTRLGTSIREIFEGYVNEDPKDVNLLIERLADIAQDLYNDYKMNRREKYDFGALMEGINRLNEFANIQSPPDDVPEVNDVSDPMSMVNPAVDGSIEVGEHSALEKLKNAICAVQCAIQSLESAEAQENGAGELNTDSTELSTIPHEDSVVEGLQTGAIDSPTLNVSGSDPMTSEVPLIPDAVGNEGPEHEQEEQGAIADLKAGLDQLQAAYAEYMGSEEKVHGDSGDTPETGIGGPLKSPEFADKLNALASVNGIDKGTFLEKVKELMEDAQLVNQAWLKKDLDKSKDVNTQEFGEEKIEEARPNEKDIETNKFVKKPVQEEVDPGTESGEISDQPGEVDLNGPIHTDDVAAGFSPENTFKVEDNVLYENKHCVVIAIDGKYLTLNNPKNGHNIEVLAEDVQYANSEDVDIRGERFSESNNTLLAAWEKIEKTLTEENLNAPKRTYDLRTNRYTEGF